MVSIPVFAIDCKSIRPKYLKERHRCISLFREVYAPEKQLKKAPFEFSDEKVYACFAKLITDYPEFDDNGVCEGVEEKNIDEKFNGYAEKCLHQNDFSECEKILSNVKNVDNIRNGNGATLLMIAVQEGDVKSMNFLLEHGASAKKVDHQGNNLLQYALTPDKEKFDIENEEKKNELIVEIVKSVLRFVHPQEINLWGKNSLVRAMLNENFPRDKYLTETLRCFINKGANVNYSFFLETSGEFSPLYEAVATNNIDAVKLFIEAKADVNKKTQYSPKDEPATPLYEAVYTGNLEVLKMLLKVGAKPNIDSKSHNPLGIAIQKGRKDMVEALIKAGANVNDLFELSDTLAYPILQYAVFVESVIRKKCKSCEDDECSKVCENDEKNSNEIIKILENAGATIPFHKRYSGIFWMQANLTEKMVLDAIKKGADVNESGSNGLTPLHLVAWHCKNPNAMSALIKNGAIVNAMTKEGGTPLLRAAMFNPNPAFIKILMNAGADINVVNSYNWNALTIAVIYNNPEVVALLLKTKLGRDLSDFEKSLLVGDAAVLNLNGPMVLETLLKNGFSAKPVGSGKNRRNPLLHALKNKKDAEIIKLLLQHGGVVDNECMQLARDLPMDTPEQRKYRNQMIDLLTRHKK